MKKFETAKLEIVKLNMADIIATSLIIGGECANEDFGTAKGGDWDEE